MQDNYTNFVDRIVLLRTILAWLFYCCRFEILREWKT